MKIVASKVILEVPDNYDEETVMAKIEQTINNTSDLYVVNFDDYSEND